MPLTPTAEDLVAYYEAQMRAVARGPQHAGLPPADRPAAFADPGTRWVTTSTGRPWPLLTPVARNSEFRPDFFDARFPGRCCLYVSVPSRAAADEPAYAEALRAALADGAVLVYELDSSPRSGELMDRRARDPRVRCDPLTDPTDDSAAAIIHFGATTELRFGPRAQPVSLVEAARRLQSEPGEDASAIARVLLRDTLADRQLDDLWRIYERQFAALVEPHPCRQMQTEEEFSAMVRHPGALTVVSTAADRIAAFAVFVEDLSACAWLRAEWFTAGRGSAPVYFAGIAVDPQLEGHRFSAGLIAAIARVVATSGANRELVFQCTNRSARYVPRLVEEGVAATGIATLRVSERYRYRYRALLRETA